MEIDYKEKGSQNNAKSNIYYVKCSTLLYIYVCIYLYLYKSHYWIFSKQF